MLREAETPADEISVKSLVPLPQTWKRGPRGTLRPLLRQPFIDEIARTERHGIYAANLVSLDQEVPDSLAVAAETSFGELYQYINRGLGFPILSNTSHRVCPRPQPGPFSAIDE